MVCRGRARRARQKRIRRLLVASVLQPHENEGEDKRVESILLPRLDTGSTPVSSTLLLKAGYKDNLFVLSLLLLYDYLQFLKIPMF